jgi:hypothetical protein
MKERRRSRLATGGAILLATLLGGFEVRAGENLLANPSFETGMEGWDVPWSRAPGAISATVIRDSGRPGSRVFKVVHRGDADWAVAHSTVFPVKPGEFYEITGWLTAKGLIGSVGPSVVVRDAAGNALEWTYGEAALRTDSGWKQVRSRFIVPEGTATIQFRLTGYGTGEAGADDLALVRLPQPEMKDIGTVSLKSRLLSLVIDGKTGLWTVTAGKETWKQPASASRIMATESRKVGDRKAVLGLTDALNGLEFTAEIELADRSPEITVTLKADPAAPLERTLEYPAAFASRDRDFVLVPFADGQIFPATEVAFSRWYDTAEWKTAMGFAGVTDLDSGYCLMAETPFDLALGVPVVESRLALRPGWRGEKGRFGYDRRLVYYFSPRGGHTALARRYRDLAKKLGYVAPFREKAKRNPNIIRLLGAVNLWAHSGGLPKDFFEDIHACGVDRAMVSLGGGWIGPKNVASVVDRLNELGYLPGHYDIYTDVWDRKSGVNEWYRVDGYPRDVIINADGTMRKGWLAKSEGKEYQGYYTCARTHRRVAQARITADLAENKYRMRFIDVVCTALFECYSPDHPTTRTEDARARADMLALVAKEFGLVTGSEEIKEYAIPVSDYSEGTDYAKFNSSAVYRVPLFELVYHDSHVSSWYTGDGSTKIVSAWAAKDLLNTLYGTMPLWMPNKEQWAKYRERFIASYHNVNTVFAAVGGAEMLTHEFLTPDRQVQRTTFSSGITVTANFGDKEYTVAKPTRILPKHGYVAQGKNLSAWRGTVDGRTVNAVETPDKVFLDAGGRIYAVGGLEWDGIAVLLKTKAGARLVLLGGGKGPVRLYTGRILTGKKLTKAAVYPLDSERKRLAPLAVGRKSGAVVFTPPSSIMMLEIE